MTAMNRRPAGLFRVVSGAWRRHPRFAQTRPATPAKKEDVRRTLPLRGQAPADRGYVASRDDDRQRAWPTQNQGSAPTAVNVITTSEFSSRGLRHGSSLDDNPSTQVGGLTGPSTSGGGFKPCAASSPHSSPAARRPSTASVATARRTSTASRSSRAPQRRASTAAHLAGGMVNMGLQGPAQGDVRHPDLDGRILRHAAGHAAVNRFPQSQPPPYILILSQYNAAANDMDWFHLPREIRASSPSSTDFQGPTRTSTVPPPSISCNYIATPAVGGAQSSRPERATAATDRTNTGFIGYAKKESRPGEPPTVRTAT